MSVITIPRSIFSNNDDMVLLPLSEYKELIRNKLKREKIVPLRKALDEAMSEVKKGMISGPYTTTSDLMNSLRA